MAAQTGSRFHKACKGRNQEEKQCKVPEPESHLPDRRRDSPLRNERSDHKATTHISLPIASRPSVWINEPVDDTDPNQRAGGKNLSRTGPEIDKPPLRKPAALPPEDKGAEQKRGAEKGDGKRLQIIPSRSFLILVRCHRQFFEKKPKIEVTFSTGRCQYFSV